MGSESRVFLAESNDRAADAADAKTFLRPKRIRRSISDFYQSTGKRVFDLFFAVVALPIVLPTLAVLYFAIRRGGPFLFAHERIGLNGKPFMCLKIRTMDVNAERILSDLVKTDPDIAREWRAHYKLRNDPRVTKLGLALRKTSLDELPQIFNVLKGEMSFVGPRPITAEELSHYGNAQDDYRSVRPGLTGLWQISGRRENDFESRARMDTEYVSTTSFIRDLTILLKTIPEVITARGR